MFPSYTTSKIVSLLCWRGSALPPSDEGGGFAARRRRRERRLPLSQKSEIFASSPDKGSLRALPRQYNYLTNWNLLAAKKLNRFTDECCSAISVLVNVVSKALICNIHLPETRQNFICT